MFFGKKKQNEELIEAITQHTRMCDARASELADQCRKWREERMEEDLKKAEEEPKHGWGYERRIPIQLINLGNGLAEKLVHFFF